MTVECVKCGARGSNKTEYKCPWCRNKMVVVDD